MNLALVMFLKGVVLSLVGVLTAIWAYAVEREQTNLTFREDRKGVYRAFAPLSAIDRWWLAAWPWIRRAVYLLVFALWAALGGSYLIGGREAAKEVALAILRGIVYLTT